MARKKRPKPLPPYLEMGALGTESFFVEGAIGTRVRLAALDPNDVWLDIIYPDHERKLHFKHGKPFTRKVPDGLGGRMNAENWRVLYYFSDNVLKACFAGWQSEYVPKDVRPMRLNSLEYFTIFRIRAHTVEYEFEGVRYPYSLVDYGPYSPDNGAWIPPALHTFFEKLSPLILAAYQPYVPVLRRFMAPMELFPELEPEPKRAEGQFPHRRKVKELTAAGKRIGQRKKREIEKPQPRFL